MSVGGKQRYRALVDTGAEISLTHTRVFESLKPRPKLLAKKISLQSVNGEALEVDACVDVNSKIGGTEVRQVFYVIPNMNRNLILGRNMLFKNRARIYFDLAHIRIGQTYVPLEHDIHIASIVRLKHSVKLEPQTAKISYVKVRNNPNLPVKARYQIYETERGCLSKEPDVSLINSVSILGKDRTIPVMIVNQTNKFIRLPRHGLVGKVEIVSENSEIKCVNTVASKNVEDKSSDINLNDIQVPPQYQSKIRKLITENQDIFAAKDSQLGHTDTVKMKIETDNHPPIKLRPYRTPLNNRIIIDEAVDEMLDAGIIQRSRSPWSFPVVI